jgi:hypothetical protein
MKGKSLLFPFISFYKFFGIDTFQSVTLDSNEKNSAQSTRFRLQPERQALFYSRLWCGQLAGGEPNFSSRS